MRPPEAGAPSEAGRVPEELRLLLRRVGRGRPVLQAAPDGIAALEDLQVLEVATDIARSTAWVLLDARQSSAVAAEGNAAVLVVEGLRGLRWTRQAEVQRVHAIRVVGGAVTSDADEVTVSLELEPWCDLVVRGGSAALHLVEVTDLPAAPVDYSSPDRQVRAGTPSWHSPARLLRSWGLTGT